MVQKNSLDFIKMCFFSVLLILGSGCSLASNSSVQTEKTVLNNNETKVVNSTETKTIMTEAEKIKPAQKAYGFRNGDKYLNKYSNDNSVQQIILVEQSDTALSEGNLYLFEKNTDKQWKIKLQCKAYLGKNGIDKSQEGDGRTPTGDYGMVMTFGIKDNPGTLIPYTKLTETMYLCGDKEYYNQFIDVSKIKHTCSSNSEHLIRYVPQYNYALFFDYNKENIYNKGSAIFLHCLGSYPFTLGCISIAEKNLIIILQAVDKNARICIYPFK